MARLGLTIPLSNPLPLADYVRVAQAAEAQGYEMAWIPEIAGPDAVTMMTLLAARSERLRVAPGVVPIQTRTPVLLGVTAATLGHLAPGRIALGLGVSSKIIVGQWHGLPFERPLAQLREAVAVIRMVLSGERVNFEGEFYRVKNFRLGIAPPPRPIPIYLAALGPRMLQLAGEIADGALLNWIPPEAIPESVRQIETGARRAGRSLAEFEVASFVRVCVTGDPGPARQWLAREVTGYAIVDSYGRFLASSGFGAEVEAVNRAWRSGDRAGAVRQISPRMLDALGVVGPADFCAQRLQEFAKAGLTQPVVFPFSPDPEPLASLLGTVRAFHA